MRLITGNVLLLHSCTEVSVASECASAANGTEKVNLHCMSGRLVTHLT